MGDKRTRHTNLQHQHQNDERLWITCIRHVVPGVDHDKQRHHHRQEVQRKADSVETDRVVRLDDGDPLAVNEELQILALTKIKTQQCIHANRSGHR